MSIADSYRTPAHFDPIRFVHAVDPIERKDDIPTAFLALIVSLGFTSATCVTLSANGGAVSVLMNTQPWQFAPEMLTGPNFIDHPLVQEARSRRRPFAWSDAPTVLEALDQTPFGDGFVVPIFESNGAIGLVCVAGEGVDLDTSARGVLSLASVYVYAKLCAGPPAVPQPATHLTRREREVMRWIVKGKTDWEIGQILLISKKTVNYHIENVKRKYGATTRMRAVMAALEEGLLVN